ncbi:gas vesicle accessory protein GvpU [Rummeliibacillus sp. TYF-LIM-RU47]|uniref:gas vesicle accessory protein GvpU n=1 Tax=Rummeliibacillus sp. TYF-LIM-RU47 TaxID=2608406 RepID=UPI00123B8CD5|nr:gas vesicle accessory protein GvpU [Rummeliibacillus sp. TYF-LIM-RU47]
MANDVFLQSLIHLTNTISGFQAGITINVNGTIISGLIIGKDEYQEKLIQSLKESKGIAPVLGQGIEESLAEVKKAKAEEDIEEDIEEKIEEYEFINLIDAHFFSPDGNALPGREGFLWRGKIESIDGFTLSQITVN